MTVVVQTPFNEHTGNGVTTVFGFTFQLLAAADLVVKVNGVTQSSSAYSISGLGVQAGGSVTFTAAPANAATVLLSRELEFKREIDYQSNGDLPSATVDTDNDRVWQAFQQQNAKLGGVVRAPYPEQLDELPAADDRAGKALVFDEDGNVTVSEDDYEDQFANVSAQASAAAASASAAAGSAAAAAATQAAQLGALVPQQASRTRVLVVGSSNAEGASATSTANSWVGLLTSELASSHVFYNVAVSGKSLNYWAEQNPSNVVAGASEYNNLELAIQAYRPDIVIGAFTTQNSINLGTQTAAYLKSFAQAFVALVQKSAAICHRYKVRFVAITPYNSTPFTALNRDFNRWIGDHIERLGIDVIDFASIWGFSGTIPPAAYDSGDGLHLNNAGHLAQRRVIPEDYISMKWERPHGAVRLASQDAGLLCPNDLVTDGPVSTSSFPAGSFSFGFNVKTPASVASTVALCGITGSPDLWRLRNPGGNPFVWTAEGIDVAVGTLSTTTEYRIDITFDAGSKTTSTYLDGVFVASQAVVYPPAGAAGTVTALAIAGRSGAPANNAVGYRFRNLTLHATCLQASDIARLHAGVVSRRSLVGVWPLDDATSRQAGAMLSQTFGGSVVLSSAVALP